jgi:hypothetical protein
MNLRAGDLDYQRQATLIDQDVVLAKLGSMSLGSGRYAHRHAEKAR